MLLLHHGTVYPVFRSSESRALRSSDESIFFSANVYFIDISPFRRNWNQKNLFPYTKYTMLQGQLKQRIVTFAHNRQENKEKPQKDKVFCGREFLHSFSSEDDDGGEISSGSSRRKSSPSGRTGVCSAAAASAFFRSLRALRILWYSSSSGTYFRSRI